MPHRAAGTRRAFIAIHSPDAVPTASGQLRPGSLAPSADEFLTEIADAEESGQWVRAAHLRARFRSTRVAGEATPPSPAA